MMKNRSNGTRRVVQGIAVAAAVLMVAGCTLPAAGTGGGFASRPAGGAVDGTWSDAGGVATSSLVNGRFVSVANDTGNRVAEGTYTYTGANSVSLDFFSLLRQTRTRANCVLANQQTLNCTNDTGQQFQLLRRSSVS